MYRKAGMYGILLSRSHPFSTRWCPIVKSCGIPAPVVPRINDAIHQIKLLFIQIMVDNAIQLLNNWGQNDARGS